MKTIEDIKKIGGAVHLEDYQMAKLGFENKYIPVSLKTKYLEVLDFVRAIPECYVTFLSNVAYNANTKEFKTEARSVAIKYKGTLMIPLKQDHEKSYMFMLPRERHTDDIRFVATGKPNRVGVATEKKLDAWLEYLTGQREDRRMFLERNRARVDKFMAKISELAEHITWNRDGLGGFAELNGIVLEFKTNRTQGHVYNELRLSHGLSGDTAIANFIKLSNNELNK